MPPATNSEHTMNSSANTSPNHPDEDPIGTAICGNCNDRGTVYRSDTGLRCADCYDDSAGDAPVTYAPSLHDYTDPRNEQMAENVEKFNNSLPDIGFDVELQDGSVWEMDKFDTHAVLMKYGDEWEQYLPALARTVATHYEKRTEPTKFASHAAWGESNHDASQPEYETQAELAPVVAYPDLRAAKMQLGLMALSDEDEDPVTVIGLDGDSGAFHQYGEHGRVTVEFTESDTDTDDDSNDDSHTTASSERGDGE